MKRNFPFQLGALVFLVNLALDVWAFCNGSLVLGVQLSLGTVLVFASGVIWLIYHEDKQMHLRRPWLIFPLAAFGYAMVSILQKSGAGLLSTPENMPEVAGLIMTHFQVGLWLVSLILFFGFVTAGSLMLRRRF